MVPQPQIANLPHVRLSFETEAGERHSELFMIDSGAGGSDIMFHARAAQALSLLDSSLSGQAKVRLGASGPGGEFAALG